MNCTTQIEINKSYRSDHLAYTITIHTETEVTNIIKNERFAFHKADWNAINKRFLDKQFLPYCYSNVDELVKQWYKWLCKIIEEKYPQSDKPQKEPPPWASGSTSHQIKVISTLKRKIQPKNRNNLSGLINLKKKEALLRKSLTQDQADYEEKLFKGKLFSELQKYLRSIHRGSRFPDLMPFGNNQAYNDYEKIKLFNRFFSSVFTRDYLLNKNQNQNHENKVHNKLVITEKQIVQILSNLDTSKACGPANIGNLILKNLPSLSKSLYLVFKTVLAKGFFPTYWKISGVVPIFKDANKSQIENYRPISFLCYVSKTYEKLIFDEL